MAVADDVRHWIEANAASDSATVHARLRAFDHRKWSRAEDARVASAAGPAEIRTLVLELGRSVASVHRRRREHWQGGHRVTRLRRKRAAQAGVWSPHLPNQREQ